MINALRSWLLEDKILIGLKSMNKFLIELGTEIKEDLKNMTASFEDLKAGLQAQAIASADLLARVDEHLATDAKLIADVQALVAKVTAGEDFSAELAALQASTEAVQAKAASVTASTEAVKVADNSVAAFMTPATPAPVDGTETEDTPPTV